MGKNCFQWTYEGACCKKPQSSCMLQDCCQINRENYNPKQENCKPQKEKCKPQKEMCKAQKEMCKPKQEHLQHESSECIKLTVSSDICIGRREDKLQRLIEKASRLVFSDDSFECLMPCQRIKSDPCCNKNTTGGCPVEISNNKQRRDQTCNANMDEIRTQSHAQHCDNLEKRKRGNSQDQSRGNNREEHYKHDWTNESDGSSQRRGGGKRDEKHYSNSKEKCKAQITVRCGGCQNESDISSEGNANVKDSNRTSSYESGQQHDENYSVKSDRTEGRKRKPVERCSKCGRRKLNKHELEEHRSQQKKILDSKKRSHYDSHKTNRQDLSDDACADEDKMKTKSSHAMKRSINNNCDSEETLDNRKSRSVTQEACGQSESASSYESDDSNEPRAEKAGRYDRRKANVKCNNDEKNARQRNDEAAATVRRQRGSQARPNTPASFVITGTKRKHQTESDASVNEVIACVCRRWTGSEDDERILNYVRKKFPFDIEANSKETFICHCIRHACQKVSQSSYQN